jgi:uncharacterized membrane protein YbhN (UPF0104 family)
MHAKKRWLWPALKALLAGTILACVTWQFVRILRAPELDWDQIRQARPEWLAASGAFYILGLGFPAIYWRRLQHRLGQHPGGLAATRAYYISHLGKYLPGKAWALVLRAGLIRGPEVRAGVAGMAAFYEVLTTMTGGVFLAALVFVLLLPQLGTIPDARTLRTLFDPQADADIVTAGVVEASTLLEGKVLALLALLVMLPVGVPILPPVFNRLAQRASSPFRQADAVSLPRVTWPCLAEALALSCGTWLLFAASQGAVFQAIFPQPPAWSWELLARYAARFALGYVSSFLIFVVPGSFGVREFALAFFLVPEVCTLTGMPGAQALPRVIVAVLILRLIWTLAEALMAGVLYWLPRDNRSAAVSKGGQDP